ncbi:MAG TPA: carbon-nitrogen hydrolase family protein [Gemmataceae bacterium]|nr:carbon-nitrogen hydrolase family protein [Gemmataceae bacterium]
MTTWKIAAVQMNCSRAEKSRNRDRIEAGLRKAAEEGARLAIFPECALTGYAFENKEEALPHAEPIPGPSTERIGALCRQLNIWAIFGLLELDGTQLFNACALVGPEGTIASYRKIHLPFLGVDRFATPGDRPFVIHDLGGLRVGITICYDGSFPESARVLTLLGADLVVLPTNWPTGARSTVKYLVQARAFENHIYYAAVNRVGEERGFHFIGQSRIVDCDGELLAATDGDGEAMLLAVLDPDRARHKQIVNIPGKYEINRVADRRPEMYGPLCDRRTRQN